MSRRLFSFTDFMMHCYDNMYAPSIAYLIVSDENSPTECGQSVGGGLYRALLQKTD